MKQAELAKALNVSQAMVSKHVAMGMPTRSVTEALAWRARFLDPRLVRRRRRGQQADPRERLDAARAGLAELDLAEHRGELLPADATLMMWQKNIAAFRAKMLAIPSRIACRIAPPGNLAEVEEALTVVIYEALQELSG